MRRNIASDTLKRQRTEIRKPAKLGGTVFCTPKRESSHCGSDGKNRRTCSTAVLWGQQAMEVAGYVQGSKCQSTHVFCWCWFSICTHASLACACRATLGIDCDGGVMMRGTLHDPESPAKGADIEVYASLSAFAGLLPVSLSSIPSITR